MSNNTYRSIIVVSVKEDVHIPFVQRHLSQPMVLIDMRVDKKSNVSFTSYNGNLRMFYKRNEVRRPQSIWFRRPLPIDKSQVPVEEGYLDYCLSALEVHFRSLYSLFPDILWVSNYYSILQAISLPSQLDVAAKLGFSIPDTVVTNNSAIAKEFVKKYKQCVVKSLAFQHPISKEGKIMKFFTRRITNKEEMDYSGLYLAPAIFQQEIAVAREVRVTVVGTKVFAAAITTKGLEKDSPIRDYKVAYYRQKAEIIIEPYHLPQNISEKCIAFVKSYNLQCSAIDLLEDKQGKLWFLENNPNGQWAFVEEKAGLQIGKALAELLSN